MDSAVGDDASTRGATCTCPLTEHPGIGEHPESDHTDERCTGSWTSEPPCGGCINCLLAQHVYYQRTSEDTR